MKLLPVGLEEQSDWEDGLWVEKSGYPVFDGSWIHPPLATYSVPEFEFEEGNEKTKNEPAPVFYVGTGNDCHVRLGGQIVPDKACRVFKEGRKWFLEAIVPGNQIHHCGVPLTAGERVHLKDHDTFSLTTPPTPYAFQIRVSDEDNRYLDEQSRRDYPNKYPGRFPYRSSLTNAPPAPEELKRLAWQTDQMRRRSEEDQVRVADWSAFSQYVKRYYYKHGIECTPWVETGRTRPVDKKPPNFPPRPYPTWISQLLTRERQVPGVDPTRKLPFASSLEASGVEVPVQASCKTDAQAQDLGNNSPNKGTTASVGDAASGMSSNSEPLKGHQSSVQEAQLQNVHLRQSFKEWLRSMDDSMFLMQYHDHIAANFDSLEQVHEIYFKHGELVDSFYEDVGVKKLGHRRIFEKWFREYCTP